MPDALQHEHAVTGLGLVTPVGCRPSVVLEAVLSGASGVREPRTFDPSQLRSRLAAEVRDFDTKLLFAERESFKFDRATRMAAAACQDALELAGLTPGPELAQAALCVGVSGGGAFQNLPTLPDGGCVVSRRAALYHARNAPNFQTTTLACLFGIRGPSFTFCNASISGAIALSFASTLLHAGRVELVLVGGSEALTLLNAVALDSLKVTSEQRCAPFSGAGGMTLGEGAAFFVLERREHAEARGARILGTLLGSAVSSDAVGSFLNNPHGRGLATAFRSALEAAGLEARDIGWIRASGTGSVAQDRAEALALKEIYENAELPAVISTEPIFGHPNGASPLLGFATALLCAGHGQVPPAIDMGPAVSRKEPERDRLAAIAVNAMGFGGGNAVLLTGHATGHATGPARMRARAPLAKVVIAGIGVVTAIGEGLPTLRAALVTGRRGLSRVLTDRDEVQVARIPDDTQAQLDRRYDGARRRDKLRKYALAACSEALNATGCGANQSLGNRTALVLGLAHGPVGAQEALLLMLCKRPQTVATGRMLLEMSRFAVVSDLCTAFGVHGFSSSIAAGSASGLHALACAHELLRTDTRIDRVVVVAADELAPLYLNLCARLGVVASSKRADFAPYDPGSGGMALGEGAVALVLEREEACIRRRGVCLARIASVTTNNDARGYFSSEPDGSGLASAIELSLKEAGRSARDIQVVYGSGKGLPIEDDRELAALERVFGEQMPRLGYLSGTLGVAESCGSLFAVVGGVLSLNEGVVFPEAEAGEALPAAARGAASRGDGRHVLVVATSEHGVNAALVLDPAPKSPRLSADEQQEQS
jgi:3-oxoacyl-[acyl-carrier-protein] synthase II